MKTLAERQKELIEVRKQSYTSAVHEIKFLDRRLQMLIDVLQPLRQSAPGDTKQKLSYITKKIDMAGKAIGMALDKINEQN